MAKKIVKTFFKLISKNSFLGFGSRLDFYLKIIETIIYIDSYLVYPGDLIINDSENKDVARIKFCELEFKLFVARFIKVNKKLTRELQMFLQKILSLHSKRLCKVRLLKAFLFSFFQF